MPRIKGAFMDNIWQFSHSKKRQRWAFNPDRMFKGSEKGFFEGMF